MDSTPFDDPVEVTAAAPPPTPFTLGVASGDPDEDGFVIWTRLAFKPTELDSGMSAYAEDGVPVKWMIYEISKSGPIQSGGVTATEANGFSVHVVVGGLRPNTRYRYRFEALGSKSRWGWSKTTPGIGSLDSTSLRLAAVSCQDFEDVRGVYKPYTRMAADRPDIVLFLGDYIYERGGDNDPPLGDPPDGLTVNQHRHAKGRYPLGRADNLPEFRLRYAWHKLEKRLRKMHAIAPWVTIWDDHEVRDNYDKTYDPQIQAYARQAYYENMPLRRPPDENGALRIYRRVQWGAFARILMLDTRQYRDEAITAPPGKHVSKDDARRKVEGRSMLGAEQEKWLTSSLGNNSWDWNLICQTTIFSQFVETREGSKDVCSDTWDGYVANRKRITKVLLDEKTRNVIIVGGDIHAFAAGETKHKNDEGVPETVATEVVAGSIASDSGRSRYNAEIVNADNIDRFKWGDNSRRGYVLLDIGPRETLVRFIDGNKKFADPLRVLKSFRIRAERPGLEALP